MTDELGAEYRYVCTTCLELLGPREVSTHPGECAAVVNVSRLDMWLMDNVEACPECGLADPEPKLPEGVSTMPEWHNEGAETVRLETCGHEVSTEVILNEHGGE